MDLHLKDTQPFITFSYKIMHKKLMSALILTYQTITLQTIALVDSAPL